MFSRAAPVALFTAFCISVAAAYVTEGRKPLTRPGAMTDAQLAALDIYYEEMRRVLQVGDTAGFEGLISSQYMSMETGGAVKIKPDILPPPYEELRDLLSDGSVASVKALLDANPDLDLNSPQGRHGAVPLIWATGHPDFMPQMVAALLEQGADPRFQTAHGYTLLHAMASPFNYQSSTKDVQDTLALLPPDILAMTARNGLTALHLALINAQTPQATSLLAQGADPNAPTPVMGADETFPGQPPLMIAGGDFRVVQALLAAGADPLATDAKGRSVLDAVTEGARVAELDLQERLSASAAEESDRAYAADYARARDMIRAAVDGRLARGE